MNGGAQFWFHQFIDGNGNPYSGVKVYHTAAGTDTLKNVWTNEAQTPPVAANPVVGDSRGMVSFYADGDYKLTIKDANDVTLYTWDNVKITPNTGTMWEGNAGTAYPSASTANRWQQFLKHDASNNMLAMGVNTGSAFKDITHGIYAHMFSSFTDAVTAADGKTLIIMGSISLPSGAITIPATVLGVHFIAPGVLEKGSATSLTILAPIVGNPMHQIFIGFAAGEVTFGAGSVDAAYPEWWYASGNWTLAMQSALDSGVATSLGYRTYDIGNAIYIVSPSTTGSKKFTGMGAGRTILRGTSANLMVQIGTTTGYSSGGCHNIDVGGFTIDGNAIATDGLRIGGTVSPKVVLGHVHDMVITATNAVGMTLKYAQGVKFTNVEVIGNNGIGVDTARDPVTGDVFNSACVFDRVRVTANATDGWYIESLANSQFIDCVTENNGAAGMHFHKVQGYELNTLVFVGGWIEYNCDTWDFTDVSTNGSKGNIYVTQNTGSVDGVVDGVTFLGTKFQGVDYQGASEQSQVTTLAASSLAAGEYFTISSPTVNYYVWYRIDGAGADPAVGGKTGIVVDLMSGDTNIIVAQRIEQTLSHVGGYANIFYVSRTNEVLTITCMQHGNTTNIADFNTGFTFSTVSDGVAGNYHIFGHIDNVILIGSPLLGFTGPAAYSEENASGDFVVCTQASKLQIDGRNTVNDLNSPKLDVKYGIGHWYLSSSIADQSYSSKTITVTGAALGDFATASLSLSLQGLQLSAYVSATDTVVVTLYNQTGGAITVGNVIVRVRVERPV